MRPVQQAKFRLLPCGNVARNLDADAFKIGAVTCKPVFDSPLPERLGSNRSPVNQTEISRHSFHLGFKGRRNDAIDQTRPVVPTLPQGADPFDTGPITPPNPGQVLIGSTGSIEFPPPHTVVKLGPQLATPASELKPPYPPSKLITEEEATLRLKVMIDERGRVIAVDPVGNADRTFLEAARRYLIAHWRYKPATEDGRAVGSSMVITLRFQLDG